MPLVPQRHITLVLGGARSGKSRYAEGLVSATPPPWTYIATAQAFDDEMKLRLAHHRSRRDERWRTVEEPLELGPIIARHASEGGAVLIDCLTLWLSNILLNGHDTERASAELIDALERVRGKIVIVSNEVGFGIVPDNRLAREFRDAQGWLNQAVARVADQVVLIAAGLPLTLK